MQIAPPEITWRCCSFSDLSVVELQHIYAVRQAVFIIEQQCIYLDVDGLDEKSWHLAAWARGQDWPLAYARLLPPGLKFAEASIGRVLTSPRFRGSGKGKELIHRAVAASEGLFDGATLRISAQAHLERFYQGFGFVAVGQQYLEDGIAHIEMLRESKQAGV